MNLMWREGEEMGKGWWFEWMNEWTSEFRVQFQWKWMLCYGLSCVGADFCFFSPLIVREWVHHEIYLWKVYKIIRNLTFIKLYVRRAVKQNPRRILNRAFCDLQSALAFVMSGIKHVWSLMDQVAGWIGSWNCLSVRRNIRRSVDIYSAKKSYLLCQ